MVIRWEACDLGKCVSRSTAKRSGKRTRGRIEGGEQVRHFRGLVATLVFAVATTAAWAQQEVEFNYNGRVHVAGSPFSGTGYFKFSLVAGSPETTIWANDGAALDGSEPSSSIATTVTQGFFSVDIGDTSVPNMAALNPTLFNRDDKVYLRSWFSDGTHGFEQMHPDRRVVNPALLGTTSFDAVDLYVNPATGSDTSAGTEAKPMKTLQNAWNSLPPTLTTTATIHLAPGTYYEGFLLSGKSVNNAGSIVILGNPDDPSQVVFKGTDDTETTVTHESCFHLLKQESVIVSGLTIMGETYGYPVTIRADRRSYLEITDCVLDHARIGVSEHTMLVATRVEIFDAERLAHQHHPNLGSLGVAAYYFSAVRLEDCNLSNVEYGTFISENSSLQPINTVFNNCYWGIALFTGSVARFSPPNCTISNCHNGVLGDVNACVSKTDTVDFLNNEDNDIVLWRGSVSAP